MILMQIRCSNNISSISNDNNCMKMLEPISTVFMQFFRLQDEIYSSGYAAAYYIKHVARLEGKVYVIGSPGLVEELNKENIQHVGFGVRNRDS